MTTPKEERRILKTFDKETADLVLLNIEQLAELAAILKLNNNSSVINEIRAAMGNAIKKSAEKRNIRWQEVDDSKILKKYVSSLGRAIENGMALSRGNRQLISLEYVSASLEVTNSVFELYIKRDKAMQELKKIHEAASRVESDLPGSGRQVNLILRGMAYDIGCSFAWNRLPINKGSNSMYLRCLSFTKRLVFQKEKGIDKVWGPTNDPSITPANIRRIAYSVIDDFRETGLEDLIRRKRDEMDAIAESPIPKK